MTLTACQRLLTGKYSGSWNVMRCMRQPSACQTRQTCAWLRGKSSAGAVIGGGSGKWGGGGIGEHQRGRPYDWLDEVLADLWRSFD